jgi:F-type H+-transporting ATPase subunit delta
MAYDPVAGRYAEALFAASQQEKSSGQMLEQLTFVGGLLRQHPDLRQFMLNPDVDPDKKVDLLDRVLKSTWSPTLKAFFHMVVSAGRAEFLPDVVDAFRDLLDKAEGRLRVLVRSAHPLSEQVLKRIKTTLERREGKHVELSTEIAPWLLGGVQVHLDHRVIDGSVQRQLAELREQLTSVRVF